MVYYCADDWTQFHNLDGEWMAKKEAALIARADAIFVTSQVLHDKFTALYPEAAERLHRVSHGVDFERFKTGRSLPPPQDVAALAHPVIGFYGNLHPWVDVALIERLAKARPQWYFLLIGQLYMELEALEALPNVSLVGRREHADLPAYCGQFDVAMIPYDMTHERMSSVNPVKTKELLAAGVPIVASMVPELSGYGDRVRCCATDEEWLHALELQLARTDHQAISETMHGEDWHSKLEAVMGVIG